MRSLATLILVDHQLRTFWAVPTEVWTSGCWLRGVNATSVPCYLPSLKNRLCDLIRVNTRRANLGSALTATEGFSFSIICMFTSFFLAAKLSTNEKPVNGEIIISVSCSSVNSFCCCCCCWCCWCCCCCCCCLFHFAFIASTDRARYQFQTET